MSNPEDLQAVIDKLMGLAYARNRFVDKEPREIVITDDEALSILARLTHQG